MLCLILSIVQLNAQSTFKKTTNIDPSVEYKITRSTAKYFLEFEDLSNLKRVKIKYFTADILYKLLEAKNLESLSITRAKVEYIGTEICEFKNLESLELSANPISSIPNCLCDSKNLRHLILWDTNVSAFDDCFSELNLRTIDIKGVKINYNEYELLLNQFEEHILITEDPCDCEFE